MNKNTKWCKECRELKPISGFREHSNTCRLCRSKRATEWENNNPERSKENKARWYRNNREGLLAKSAEKYKANPEIMLARVKKWSLEHREQKDATCSRWHKEHPRSGIEAGKRWRKNNPDAARAIKRNRRMRIMGVSGSGWSAKEENKLIEDYGHRCAYCGKKIEKLTMDHVVPISRGGNHSIDNIVPACGSCNSSKHDKPLLIWMWQQRSSA